jgi:hypothetical protein
MNRLPYQLFPHNTSGPEPGWKLGAAAHALELAEADRECNSLGSPSRKRKPRKTLKRRLYELRQARIAERARDRAAKPTVCKVIHMPVPPPRLSVKELLADAPDGPNDIGCVDG